MNKRHYFAGLLGFGLVASGCNKKALNYEQTDIVNEKIDVLEEVVDEGFVRAVVRASEASGHNKEFISINEDRDNEMFIGQQYGIIDGLRGMLDEDRIRYCDNPTCSNREDISMGWDNGNSGHGIIHLTGIWFLPEYQEVYVLPHGFVHILNGIDSDHGRATRLEFDEHQQYGFGFADYVHSGEAQTRDRNLDASFEESIIIHAAETMVPSRDRCEQVHTYNITHLSNDDASLMPAYEDFFSQEAEGVYDARLSRSIAGVALHLHPALKAYGLTRNTFATALLEESTVVDWYKEECKNAREQ